LLLSYFSIFRYRSYSLTKSCSNLMTLYYSRVILTSVLSSICFISTGSRGEVDMNISASILMAVVATLRLEALVKMNITSTYLN
jgi:hypothetical protein